MNKTEKHNRKPKYNQYICFKWIMVKLWKTNKSIALSAICVIPLKVILYALGIYFSPFLIQIFDGEHNFYNIAICLCAILVLKLMFTLLINYIDAKRDVMQGVFQSILEYEAEKKERDIDRYLLLLPEIQEKINRGKQAATGNGYQFPIILSDIISDVLCFIIFGSVVSALNIWIVLFLVIGSFAIYVVQNYKNKKDYQDAIKRDINLKKLNYVSFNVSRNMKFGKDIRLYNMIPFLTSKIENLIKEHSYYFIKRQNTHSLVMFTSIFVSLIRDGIAYIILISEVCTGDISVAQFSMYFLAISKLSSVFSNVLNSWSRVKEGALQISDYLEFLDISGKLPLENGLDIKKNIPLSIEFKNVSFKYPGSEKKVLDDISFKINAGERVALVGLNGAGKTTLTMLCCGLLLPDSGTVLIEGHSVLEYNRDKLYSAFSILPQNFSLLPTTIGENITLQSQELWDENRLIKSIHVSGLEKKVSELKYGLNTFIDKRYNLEGVELSGGEIQKLLLARAYYRNAPVLILDEPTASLDPIAEDEMYKRYRLITQNCTSIFISHRLASTRFCDKIFLLDGMRLLECGTHEELMCMNGKYKKLFDLQSEYYK